MKSYYETFARSIADNVKKLEDASEDRIGKVWNQGGKYQGKIIREIDHESEVLDYVLVSLMRTIGMSEKLGEDYSSTQMIKGTQTKLEFLDLLEALLETISWRSFVLKQAFITIAISFSNNNEKRTRVGIRNVLTRCTADINSVLELIEECDGIGSDEGTSKLWQKNLHEDVKFIQDSKDWVTVYRGFNTKKDESIRYSNNKKKADYYRQQEGMGFSFTLDKYVAYAFSLFFQLRVLRSTSKSGWHSYYEELVQEVDKHSGVIGHATIGRYVVHRDNIKGYHNRNSEREIVCDYRDVKLINYNFLSDIKFNNKELLKWESIISAGHDKIVLQLKKDKNSWINKNWNKQYKVSKDQEVIFLKTKK